MSKIINKINITEEEIAYLESILRQPTSEARAYVRARILLLKHEGYTNEGIAYKLDISLSTVKLCLRKFSEGGVGAALNDRKGAAENGRYRILISHGSSTRHAKNQPTMVIPLNYGIRPVSHVLFIPWQERKATPGWQTCLKVLCVSF